MLRAERIDVAAPPAAPLPPAGGSPRPVPTPPRVMFQLLDMEAGNGRGVEIAQVDAGWLSSGSTIIVTGRPFRLATLPEQLYAMTELAGGRQVATANREAPGRWLIKAGARELTLARRRWSRTVDLRASGSRVGTITPTRARGRGATADLAGPGLDLPSQVFLLALLLPGWTPTESAW